MPSYQDWTEAEKNEQAQRIAKAVWEYGIDLGTKAKKAAWRVLREIRNSK